MSGSGKGVSGVVRISRNEGRAGTFPDRSLMYAAIRTRPDIMYAVHSLSQFSVAPSPAHMTAIKRVYWYLNGTQNLGLTFHGDLLEDSLLIYSDADWAGDPNSWRSVSGYV